MTGDDIAMSRILVTGASGFIGRAVIGALAAQGHLLRAAVRRKPQPPFPRGIETIQHPDLAESFDWAPLLEDVDCVLHLAGIAHSPRGVDSALYDRVNSVATGQLATASSQAGVRRFVFISSIRAQSGPAADGTLTESDPALPVDVYGRSKLAAEETVRAAGVPFTILRPVVLYGPGMKGHLALLARAAASPWPLPVRDFQNRRSLLGIDNFISAVAFVLATPATLGETYVVADPGMPPRLSEIITVLRHAMGRQPRIVPMPTRYVEVALRTLRRVDVWSRLGGDLRVDAGKLMAVGWRPPHDTLSGLAAMALAARRNARV